MAYGSGYAGGYADTVAAMATALIEFAPTSDPGAESPTWVDITDRVRISEPVRTSRGRQFELDEYRAGTANVVLDNTDRTFDDTYEDSDYWPDVKPMKRFRIRATHSGVTYPVFDGFVDYWDLRYGNPNEATATVKATDGFKVLSASDLASSAFAQEVIADAPGAWWRFDEQEGTVVYDQIGGRDMNAYGAPTFGAPTLISRDDGSALELPAITDGVYAEHSRLVILAGPLSVEIVVRTATTSINTIAGNISYAGGTGWAMNPATSSGFVVATAPGVGAATGCSVTIGDDTVHHLVGVWNNDDTLQLFVDGVDRTVGTPSIPLDVFETGGGYMIVGGSPFDVGIVGTVDELVLYDYALDPARIAVHAQAVTTPWDGDLPGERAERVLDAIGWPVALRDLDDGESTLQSAELDMSALDHLRKVSQSEFGDLFITRDGKVRLLGRAAFRNPTSSYTFDDIGGPAYSDVAWSNTDELIRNDVTVSRNEGIAQRHEDPDSVQTYLRHSYRLQGLIHDNDDLSRDAAHWLVAQYKDPKRRLTGLVVKPAADPAVLWPIVLGLELGDVITVQFAPPGGGDPFVQVSLIEGIGHGFTGHWWETTFTLSPVSDIVTAEWDDDTALWDEALWAF